MVILAILCPCRLRPKWGSQAVDQEEISKCEEGKWMTIVWFPLGIVEKRHVGVQHVQVCVVKWVIRCGIWSSMMDVCWNYHEDAHISVYFWMAMKDGTTSKNMLPRGLTSLLDSGKNKAIAALATPKHHATEGRNGRLRNSKTPWPWRTERPPKTCCPGAWRPFWILVKTKRVQLLGLLLLLELVPNGAFWTNKKPAPKCSSHALKAAPQQSPSRRLRNSKKDGTTPKNMLSRGLTSLLKRVQLLGLLLLLLELVPNVAFWTNKKPAPK